MTYYQKYENLKIYRYERTMRVLPLAQKYIPRAGNNKIFKKIKKDAILKAKIEEADKIKPLVRKESEICKEFVAICRRLMPIWKFKVFHIPNEQFTTYAYTKHLLAMGMLPGVADYCVMYPKRGIAYIEFKRTEKLALTANQIAFQKMCEEYDIPFIKVSSSQEAIDFIKDLLT